jgi:hypothetical protein
MEVRSMRGGYALRRQEGTHLSRPLVRA